MLSTWHEHVNNYQNIRLLSIPITDLDFPQSYFDLIISNRVLQHIPPNSIESTMRTICRLGRFIYINELSDTDAGSPNPYMFQHDYVQLFGLFGLVVKNSGFFGKQTWFLFTKIADIGQRCVCDASLNAFSTSQACNTADVRKSSGMRKLRRCWK